MLTGDRKKQGDKKIQKKKRKNPNQKQCYIVKECTMNFKFPFTFFVRISNVLHWIFIW